MEVDSTRDEELLQNYARLKEIVETGLSKASQARDLHVAKGFLIEVQNQFRGLKLLREHREMLYNKLQDAFTTVNAKIEEEHLEFEYEALSNYADLKPLLSEAISMASQPQDSKQSWDFLISLQNRIKVAKLLREQRDELYAGLQEAFGTIKARREEEHRYYENEVQQNYVRLKALVEKGLTQAEESHEYKETREFLKKIQSEFKGIKMIHEQREELYSRLQSAFDILGKRLDEFFRHKKKNWEVKMQFTLSRFSAEIFELQETINKEQAYLDELEDQLDIIVSAGIEKDAKTGLQARINSTRRSIERKHQQILNLELEKTELQTRLENPENE